MTTPLRTLRFLTLTLGTVLLSGCLLSAPHLDPVRHDMEARIPGVVLEPQIHLHLGRMSLGLVKGITRLAMDEGDAEEEELINLMRHVKGVEVAIYETESLLAGGSERWSDYMSELGMRRGWVPAAQVRDDGAASAVFFKMKGDEIRNVYVFTLNEENMVLVRFKGHLERIIADGLALYGDQIAEGLVNGELDEDFEEIDEDEVEEPSTDTIAASSLTAGLTAQR